VGNVNHQIKIGCVMKTTREKWGVIINHPKKKIYGL